MPSQIAVINQSRKVSEYQCAIMVSALNNVLPKFCKDWGLSNYIAIVSKSNTKIPFRVFIVDGNLDTEYLGYHDNSPTNTDAIGYVNTAPILNNGAVLYSKDSQPTIAQTLSHEIFEMLVDPLANLWAHSDEIGSLYAYECCDAVQNNVLVTNVMVNNNSSILKRLSGKKVSVQVGLSDWLLPAWFDPGNTVGPFNNKNTLKSPFTIDNSGYVIVLKDNVVDYIFGKKINNDQKEVILHKRRISARFKKTTSVPQSEYHKHEDSLDSQ
jgi:hypothetical protein